MIFNTIPATPDDGKSPRRSKRRMFGVVANTEKESAISEWGFAERSLDELPFTDLGTLVNCMDCPGSEH